jgi:PAS domain S-box-containing protein
MSDRGPHNSFDDLGVGVAQIAPGGSWIGANRALCDLLGYTQAELTNKAFETVFVKPSQQAEDSRWERLARGEISGYKCNRTAIRKDGTSLPVAVIFSAEQNSSAATRRSILAVIEDLTDLHSAETARLSAEAARHEMAQRFTAAQENERTRIARELHDDIGQSLAILRIQMMRAGQPVSGMPGKVHPGMPELSGRLKDIAQKVSKLSHQLHSSELEYLGLAVAVQSHCGEFSEKFKIKVECVCEGIPENLDSLLALSLLRVMQEALHNAGKYSGAKAITVNVRGTAEELSLLVADNGAGFDVEEARLAAGLGLISMRERIHLAGGEFAITSKSGEGTRITARVPVAEKQ